MIASLVKVDCARIKDWDTFHDEFHRVLGFPDFYGRNMNAWIDCMTFLDDPGAGMSTIHCDVGKMVTIELENVKEFKKRCPEQYDAIIECSAFVNWRRIETGELPVLALSFYS